MLAIDTMMPPETYRTRCSVMRRTLKATSSSYRALSSTEAFPWPSTATATQSSSIHASLARRQPDRPSSPALCKSWGYSRYSLGHRKLRAESNGLPGPSRTGWLLSYGWRAQPLSRRPTRSCGVTCPASMSSSECRRHSPPSPTVPQMACMSRPYSASNTAARWPGITPSSSTGTRSNYSVDRSSQLRGILRGGPGASRRGARSAAWEQHDPYPGGPTTSWCSQSPQRCQWPGCERTRRTPEIFASVQRQRPQDWDTNQRGQQGKAQAAPTAHSTPEGSMEGCPES